MQDAIFKPNHYLSLLEFRQLTLERLQKFVAQRYFITKDYIDGGRNLSLHSNINSAQVLHFFDECMT